MQSYPRNIYPGSVMTEMEMEMEMEA